jgi:hypothetical protein
MNKYNDKYMYYFTCVFFYKACTIKMEAVDNNRTIMKEWISLHRLACSYVSAYLTNN